jgi:hypothetical protein
MDFLFGWIACWVSHRERIMRVVGVYWDTTKYAMESGLTIKQIWVAAFPGSRRPRVASHCTVCGGLRSFSVLAGGEKVCESSGECAKELIRETTNALSYPERISRTILRDGELISLACKEMSNSQLSVGEEGHINYRDDRGRLHRLDGPAVISPTRNLWYVRGQRLNFDRDIKPLMQNFFDTKHFEDLNAGQKITLAIVLIKTYALTGDDTVAAEEEQDE